MTEPRDPITDRDQPAKKRSSNAVVLIIVNLIVIVIGLTLIIDALGP